MPELPPLPSKVEASTSAGSSGQQDGPSEPSYHQLSDDFEDTAGDALAQEMQALSLQAAVFSAIGAVEGVATTRHDA